MERKEGGVTEIGQTRREQALCWVYRNLHLHSLTPLERHVTAGRDSDNQPRKTDIVALGSLKK